MHPYWGRRFISLPFQELFMDFKSLGTEYHHLEVATDTAVLLTETEWQAQGLSDEDLAPEYGRMFPELKRLNKRSLSEDLRHSDPRALFDMVRYAKHLGFWKGYHHNERRLRYVEDP